MRRECMRCIRVATARDIRCRCSAIQSNLKFETDGKLEPQMNADLRTGSIIIEPRAVGDRVGSRFLFDRRMGGACFCWFKQVRARDSDRARVNADDLFSSRLRRDAARHRLSHRQLHRCREAPAAADAHRDCVNHLYLWFLSRWTVRCVGDFCWFRSGRCFSSMRCRVT